ncbi:hypothetical protein CEXT_736801 [Caerostris extrusa]|uniref:Uncharacterized protein n=1 Tax=Caerostris extrusa TaxID=172846 RepID=A0AAV4XWN7_CAEEX|nr:hypothetical protein CEXT_736801 [Caerostris extrusa]
MDNRWAAWRNSELEMPGGQHKEIRRLSKVSKGQALSESCVSCVSPKRSDAHVSKSVSARKIACSPINYTDARNSGVVGKVLDKENVQEVVVFCCPVFGRSAGLKVDKDSRW